MKGKHSFCLNIKLIASKFPDDWDISGVGKVSMEGLKSYVPTLSADLM